MTTGTMVRAAAPVAARWEALEARLGRGSWPIVLGLLFAMVAWAGAHHALGFDFVAFYQAGERLLRGEELYRLSDKPVEFKYLPAAAVLLVPLQLLPERAANLVFNLLSALAIVRVMQWSAARVGRSHELATHLAVLAAASPFALHLFVLGQCDALLLWCMVESEARAERSPLASGVLWAVAVLFKPPYLAFLLLALAWRQRRRVAGLALGLAGGALLGTACFGVAGHLAELASWRALLGTTTPGLLCNEENQSVYGVACQYLAAPGGWPFQVAVLLLSAAAVLAAGAAVVRIRARSADEARFAAAAASFWLTGFLSPLGWWTTLLATVPALYLLVALARSRAPIVSRALAAALLAALFLSVGGLPARLGVDMHVLLLWRHFGLLAVAALLMALASAASGVGRKARPPSSSAQARPPSSSPDATAPAG
jgi:hypothetical protein